MRKICIIFGLSLLVLSSLKPTAAHALRCDTRREKIAEARFEVMQFRPDECWYSIAPDWEPSFVYRSYIFDHAGYILIFNSLGDGPENETTGAREYMFFPRTREISATPGPNIVIFHLPNGADLVYDAKKLNWAASKGVKLREDPAIHANNSGGVELSPEYGLMIDFGWRMGSAPSGNVRGTSQIVDSKGQSCRVRNSDILTWDASGDPNFKFKTDQAFYAFVRSTCASLQF